jgi:hypothetical protein
MHEVSAVSPTAVPTHTACKSSSFVVHFHVNSEVVQGQLAGRVEHIVSGQAVHFASLEELLAFIGQVLTTCTPHSAEERAEGAANDSLAMAVESRRSSGEKK